VFGTLSLVRAQAQEITAPMASNKALEVTIGSTEFKYEPAKAQVTAGRAVTLVLDNSGAETEHVLVLPAFNFRLEVKAGKIARKSIIFYKPGEYDFSCQAAEADIWALSARLSTYLHTNTPSRIFADVIDTFYS
jgi:plastocyanin